jgi:hypothetical protein
MGQDPATVKVAQSSAWTPKTTQIKEKDPFCRLCLEASTIHNPLLYSDGICGTTMPDIERLD